MRHGSLVLPSYAGMFSPVLFVLRTTAFLATGKLWVRKAIAGFAMEAGLGTCPARSLKTTQPMIEVVFDLKLQSRQIVCLLEIVLLQFGEDDMQPQETTATTCGISCRIQPMATFQKLRPMMQPGFRMEA